MKYSKDYFTGMKHFVDAMNYELVEAHKYYKDKCERGVYDNIPYYYNGVMDGLNRALICMNNVLEMQLEVKGEE